MDINQTYCGVHFAKYTNIEQLCYIPANHVIYKLDLKLI